MVYFAGMVRADGTVRSGTGFTVTRLGAGTYRIDFPADPRNLITTPTPWTPAAMARVTTFSRSALDTTSFVVVELRDLTGSLVDSEFTFFTVERS
jgi:hypothetical protein